MKVLRFVFLWAGIALIPVRILAQGGPPMITDDPGTPGNGHWENTVAAIVEASGDERQLDVPFVDINYGWGDRIQLKFEMPLLTNERFGDSWLTRAGNARIGTKIRFLELEPSGFSASVYPQFEFSTSSRSPDEPLRMLLLPLQMSVSLGNVDLCGDVGYTILHPFSSEVFFGILGGYSPVTSIQLLAELHETIRGQSAGSELLANVGSRIRLTHAHLLLLSIGRSLHSPRGSDSVFFGFVGLQFIL